MPELDEIAQQQRLLHTHRYSLNHLLHQQAIHGAGYVPTSVAHGIEEARAAITHIKQTLRTWGIDVTDHPDDASDPTPLLSHDHYPHNVPAPPTSLIGRAQEVTHIGSQLCRPDIRLLTLTGTGGVGKTHLALQVAAELLNPAASFATGAGTGKTSGPDRFTDGIWFVGLTPVSDPALVIPAIALTLGVRESSSQSLLELVKSYLRDKQLLLVLDNFEQVIDAGPIIAELLAVAPDLTILVTSRMALHLAGEYEIVVQPLELPPRHHTPTLLPEHKAVDLLQYAAIRLFNERALAVKADFVLTAVNTPAVAEICYRLDGLPLAIELAAVRSKLFTPQALLTRLDRPLHLLTGGPRDRPSRQQTLRNTIDWSYNLLNTGEQTLFARLGVFVGDCTLEAATAVCNADSDLPCDTLDGLTALIDQSLVRQIAGMDSEPCFAMLATIREYARERLAAREEMEHLRQQHGAYYLHLAEQAESYLYGPIQGHWFDRLEAEHDNLRTALEWARERDDRERWLRLAWALWRFWEVRGYLSEGRHWLEQGLAQSSGVAASVRARAYIGAGKLAIVQSDYESARVHLEASLTLFRELHDQRGIADALNHLGHIALYHADFARAQSLYEAGLKLRRALGDQRTIADSLINMGNAIRAQGDNDRAQPLYEESLALFQEVGEAHGISTALANLGIIAFNRCDYTRAQVLYEEALTRRRTLGHRSTIAEFAYYVGQAVLRQGDLAYARVMYTESLTLYRALEDDESVISMLEEFADLTLTEGRPEQAAQLFAVADHLLDLSNIPSFPSQVTERATLVTAIRAQLDPAAFTAAWAAGQALSLERAITIALETTN